MSEHTPADKTRQLRALLPAAEGEWLPPGNGPSRRPARPPQVSAACAACRKHKYKCPGERPACSRCVLRRLTCEYITRPGETRRQAVQRSHSDLQKRATVHEEIVGLLKTLPDQDAQDLLRRLRSGADVDAILSHVKAGDVLLQMAVVPETRLRYEFPYRKEMPAAFTQNNPYMESMIYETASLYPSGQQPNSFIGAGTVGGLSSEEQQSLYMKPFHAARIVEPRLSDAKPSAWTAVTDDDGLMRDLLEFLFRCEYQFTAAFQKDLFLEDMTTGRTDFCSSILVNIVLAYSCVCYPRFENRSEYWNPHTLVYRFLAEAKRIWELEATEPRITTIQAGILFSVFHNLCGLDEIGQPYRIQAVSLARRLRIFDITPPGLSNRSRRGRKYAAWALFNWETLVAFSFMIPPLLTDPPIWSLPDPSEDSGWYGEVWVKYPLSHTLSPTQFGHTFRERSRFRIVMNEFCHAAYSAGSTVTLGKANGFRKRLETWYQGLPEPLSPRTIVLPGHLQLHVYYHHLLLTMFEPLLDAERSHEPSPEQVVADSKKYLQTLVRLYYLRHGFEAMDLFIVIPLMLTGYDCIDTIHERTPEAELETLRSTLILITKGLYCQRRNHFLAEALFRVIRGRMRPQELSLLRGTMTLDEIEEDRKRDMVQYVQVKSHWPVSVVKNREDVESHVLARLVESYGRLNVDERVTEQV